MWKDKKVCPVQLQAQMQSCSEEHWLGPDSLPFRVNVEWKSIRTRRDTFPSTKAKMNVFYIMS